MPMSDCILNLINLLDAIIETYPNNPKPATSTSASPRLTRPIRSR